MQTRSSCLLTERTAAKKNGNRHFSLASNPSVTMSTHRNGEKKLYWEDESVRGRKSVAEQDDNSFALSHNSFDLIILFAVML